MESFEEMIPHESKFKKSNQYDRSVLEEIRDKRKKEIIAKAEMELARLKKDSKSSHIKLDLKDIKLDDLKDTDKEAFYEAFKIKNGWDEYSEGFKDYDEEMKEYEKNIDGLSEINDSRATLAGMIRQHVVLETMKKKGLMH
jgi:hypothetical protein